MKEIGAKVGGMSEVATSQVVRRLEDARKRHKDVDCLLTLLEAKLLNVEP